MKVLRIETK